jgi:hypothetical protein
VAPVIVEAARIWNHTHVRLEAGVTYDLVAEGRWVDKVHACGPDGYDSPNLLMKLAEFGRRVRGAKWFALIGALDEDPATAVVIGSRATWIPPRDGELTCFANDWRSMYGNNRGSVTLTVTRRLSPPAAERPAEPSARP